jgi:predicted NodU family carbamoyl transferase
MLTEELDKLDKQMEVYENNIKKCSKKNTCSCNSILSESIDHCHDFKTGEICSIHEKHCLNCHFPFCNCTLQNVIFEDPEFTLFDLEYPLIPVTEKEIKEILIVLQEDIFALYAPNKYRAIKIPAGSITGYQLKGIDFLEHHVTHAAIALYCLRKAMPGIEQKIKEINPKLHEVIDLLIEYQTSWPENKEKIEQLISKKIESKMKLPKL